MQWTKVYGILKRELQATICIDNAYATSVCSYLYRLYSWFYWKCRLLSCCKVAYRCYYKYLQTINDSPYNSSHTPISISVPAPILLLLGEGIHNMKRLLPAFISGSQALHIENLIFAFLYNQLFANYKTFFKVCFLLIIFAVFYSISRAYVLVIGLVAFSLLSDHQAYLPVRVLYKFYRIYLIKLLQINLKINRFIYFFSSAIECNISIYKTV